MQVPRKSDAPERRPSCEGRDCDSGKPFHRFPGGKRTDEHCFSSIYGGKFLRDRHTVHASGRPDSFGQSIYFSNSIAKRIEYLYIESDGGYS